jgi:hypothetical protein
MGGLDENCDVVWPEKLVDGIDVLVRVASRYERGR